VGERALSVHDEEEIRAGVVGRRQTKLAEATAQSRERLTERRFLRAVLLADGETAHNAFFDRRSQP
jgi:hypothetical protein